MAGSHSSARFSRTLAFFEFLLGVEVRDSQAYPEGEQATGSSEARMFSRLYGLIPVFICFITASGSH